VTGSARGSCRLRASASAADSIRRSCRRRAIASTAATCSARRSSRAPAFAAVTGSARGSCRLRASASAADSIRRSCRHRAIASAVTGSARCGRSVRGTVFPAATGLDRCRRGAPYAARHAAAGALRPSGKGALPGPRERASQRSGSLRESRGREGRGGTVAHLPSPSLGRFRQVTRAFGENGTAAPRMTSRFHVLSSYGYGGCDRPALGRMLSRSGLPSRRRRAQSAHGVGPPPRGAVRAFPAGVG
jgi:hypothetical protein